MTPKNISKRLKTILSTPKKKSNHSRRDFIQKAGAGGLALGYMFDGNVEKELEYSTQKVNRSSNPSDLKITDLRIAYTSKAPIIKIDTNQGIYGLGEVRDHGSPKYALFLKSRLIGKNPCNVEQLFKMIKQYGGQGRQGGGVSGVEMALWDLAGKAYGVPVYQLLGGKYRDKIRFYADTPSSSDPKVYATRMKSRIDKGFTFLKMDFGVQLVKDVPGALIGAGAWDQSKQWSEDLGSYGMTKHPFTRIQITDLGLEKMVEYVHQVRDIVGYEVPMAADHFGHIDMNACIRLGNAVEKYQLAWLEDLVPWMYHDQWRQITEAIATPTLTGEDIYLKEEFIKLIDKKAVDMVHPDLASAGGILETKKIGDYAEEHGIAMAMHFAGTPISFLANVHCAAATQNFVALEHHDVDTPWWEDLVKGIEKPILKDGFVKVPETPGLGVDLNDEVIKEHLREGEKYFAPTPEWDKDQSWDRTWS
ncbi:MAG: mandelate racemase/muconate lactonizing enzyme family protein [Cyclobacteriaceae bacterium]|nr:mandelate racemase/muconate lactonizing enzyme family protein [Cyclobacteriaceae bacterium]